MTTKDCKKHIKCVVFDLDGTLLNTIKTINYYLNFALGSHGLSSVSEKDTMRFVGDGAVKLIERALTKVNADPSLFEAVYKTYNEAYNAHPHYLTEIYNGIPELLLELKNRGIVLAVLSNKPDFAVKATVDKFFPGTFSLIEGGKEGIPLKPHPDSLINLIASLEISTDDVMYVGDSEVDVLTARNAKIATSLSVNWGFRSREQLAFAGAERIIDSPSEVLKFV